ncbi:MAG: nitronate monooxygenase [Actinomycetota bacterium]
MLHTRFTELFGLDHPLMSAPMAMHSGGTLAAAVSSAGALGSFGGISQGGPGWITEQAELVRSRTDRPFAIGFITTFLPGMAPLFDAALAARPDVVALSFGDPRPWVDQVRDAGARLICQVQSVDDADVAVEAGTDVLAVQGTEAGGHTGTMTLLPLLSAVASRHPSVPLLAAGAIGDGRGLAGALVAGADGAWLGTAFLATNEAIEIDDDYRRAIVESNGADTLFTRVFDIASRAPWPDGIGARMRRDAFTDEWADREAELRDTLDTLPPPPRPLYYGQSAAFINGVRSADDVVQSISADAERVLRERPASLLS